MKNIIISILSVIIAFSLCVLAIALKKYWILAAMIVVGTCGVLVVAYLKAKNMVSQINKIIKD